MNNNSFAPLNDMDFEDFLLSSLSAEPPADIVNSVTPWKKAIKRVLIGLALSTLIFNIFYLNYILPTVGTILSILGLRLLRSENKWFKRTYAIAIIHAIYKFFILAINTTAKFRDSIPDAVYWIFIVLLTLSYIVCLCKALYEVQIKSGIEPRKAPLVSLVVWYTVLCTLAVINFSGYILPIVMIIGFIVIMVNLSKISKDLENSGYAIRTESVSVSDKALTATMLIVLMLSLVFGYLSGSTYKMQWQPVEETKSSEVQNIKEHLIGLGMPEMIADDMSDEDILACKDAKFIYGETKTYPFNTGREEITVYETSGSKSYYHKTVYDVKEMTVTHIGVCLDEEMNEWQIIHHFLWDINPGFMGTEAISIELDDNWIQTRKTSGRVLYTKDGINYTSPYYSLGEDVYTSDDIFFGTNTYSKTFANFSLPNKGEKQRGYVTYGITASNHWHVVQAYVNYNHQQNYLQYPAVTAKTNLQNDFFNHNKAFRQVQAHMQFWDDEMWITTDSN